MLEQTLDDTEGLNAYYDNREDLSTSLTMLAELVLQVHKEDNEEWRKVVHDTALAAMQLTDIDKPIWNVVLRRNSMPADPQAVRDLGYSITRMFEHPMPWDRCTYMIGLYQTVSWKRPYTYTIVHYEYAAQMRVDWTEQTGEIDHDKDGKVIPGSRQTI